MDQMCPPPRGFAQSHHKIVTITGIIFHLLKGEKPRALLMSTRWDVPISNYSDISDHLNCKCRITGNGLFRVEVESAGTSHSWVCMQRGVRGKSRGLQSSYSCGPENRMLEVQVKIKHRSEPLRDVPARLPVAGLHPFRPS